MSGEEDFLSRWSRRKRSAEESGQTPEPPAAELSTLAGSGAEKPGQSKEEEFDLSTLPSLESIVPGTDMSVFLQKGVPLDLTRAALRRAWSADPAIRDFIGLAENAWDFNDPKAMHGFGPLDQSPEEVRQMLAQVMGEVRRIAEPIIQSEDQLSARAIVQDSVRSRHAGDEVPRVDDQSAGGEELASSSASLPEPERELDVAAQHAKTDDTEFVPVMRRTHGGALPK
jgi:hypothetical protein